MWWFRRGSENLVDRSSSKSIIFACACAALAAAEPALPPLLPGAPPPCTIAREPALDVAGFRARYKGHTPVVISVGGANANANANASSSSSSYAAHYAALRARLARAALLASHGDFEVTLASSNSFSHAKREATLREYVEQHVDAAVDAARPADAVWYMFGDTPRSPAWDALTAGYAQPLDAAGDSGLVVLGVGGRGSGVAFHTHGAAFGETLIGAKQWFLAPPGRRPRFAGDVTTLQWELERRRAATAAATVKSNGDASDADASDADASASVVECVVGEGEAIYVPPQWFHATLNHGPYNVFISTFTLEKTR